MNPLTEEELIQYYHSLSDEDKVALSKQLRNGTNGKYKQAKARRKNLTHTAVGKLFFDSPEKKDSPKPIHNIDVELWDRDVTNPDDFLGSGKTNLDGSFEILYDPLDAGKMDLPDLELRVFERQHKFDKHENVRDRKKLIYAIKGEDNVTRKRYDLATTIFPTGNMIQMHSLHEYISQMKGTLLRLMHQVDLF